MIEYVIITSDAGIELHDAQCHTCLYKQIVHTLGDEDDLDRQLKLLSSGRKTLRWWLTHKTFADWMFFCDDDTWIFVDNLENVCSHLSNDKPQIFTHTCSPWGAKHVMRDLFGYDQFPRRTQEMYNAIPGITFTGQGTSISWHGGAGLLMNKKACELTRCAMFQDEFYKEAFNVLCFVDISVGPDVLWPWMLPQDLIMPRALALAINLSGLKKCDVYKGIHAPQRIFSETQHAWTSYGTNFPSRLGQSIDMHKTQHRCVADFNEAYCVKQNTKDEIDVEQAIKLSRVHEPTRRKNMHLVDDFASLCTMHRIKKPKMMYDLYAAQNK